METRNTKSNEAPDTRIFERTPLSAPTMVKGKDDANDVWKENSQLISVSRSGAGFLLERECHVGRLLSLIIPMPRHLRSYDTDKELYRVWGIIQHCNYLPEQEKYQVGVAFVGKSAPESYLRDARQSFRITGITEKGMWKITESEKPFITRRYPRFTVGLDVLLAELGPDGLPKTEVESFTENISIRGASVFSSLNANVGDGVRFSTRRPEFSVLAVVRDRKPAGESGFRLHLEFVTADFPVKDVEFPVFGEPIG